jgi:6-pyruvoyltetrahydropterin/6-carboxytetrahydropterin synthase
MSFQITRTYRFEAAHFLPKVPDSHKCKRVHGHNYRVDVTVRSGLDDRGFVMDFFELDAVVDPIVEELDHRCLNEITLLDNPTAEILAHWFWARVCAHLKRGMSRLDVSVRVYETADCSAEYA